MMMRDNAFKLYRAVANAPEKPKEVKDDKKDKEDKVDINFEKISLNDINIHINLFKRYDIILLLATYMYI